ncbi:MAG: LamG domain-containing protein, partial [Nanoarchaeota archaeon]|nr:LamG domain-containing protein [Nanoarchaeota archaeon]
VPSGVSVAPVFVVGEREKVGSVMSTVDVGEGVSSGRGAVYGLGREYEYEVPTDGLVSWWKFDGNADDSWGDNDGEVYGEGDELVDGVLSLDGSGDWVSIGDWFNYQEFSISMWVKPGSVQNVYADIIDNNHDGNSNWVIQQNVGNTNSYNFGGVSFVLVADVWQYFVVSIDGANCYIYLDDDLVNSGACYVAGINYDANPFRNLNFGRHYSLSGRDWRGSMDNVMIYNRALSQEEITAIYETQKK